MAVNGHTPAVGRGCGQGIEFDCMAISHVLCKMQGKRWCFTINFPFNEALAPGAEQNEDVGTRLRFAFDDLDSPLWGVYGGAQVEVAPSTGMHHIQGFCVFDSNKRLSAVKKVHATAHWELMKGKLEDSERYCSKDETRLAGTFPKTWGHRPTNEQGRRTDLEEAIDALKDASGPPSKRLRAVALACPAAYVKFHRGLESLAAQLATREALPKPEWRPWQAELEEILSAEPDKRTIYWYTDGDGGAGKSTFTGYYVCNEELDAITLSGKVADMAYTYQGERVVFFDVSRTQAEHMDHLYSFAEHLKNGIIHSTKYTPVLKTFKPPHVVFFSNGHPAVGKWSADRVKEVVLSEPPVFHA